MRPLLFVSLMLAGCTIGDGLTDEQAGLPAGVDEDADATQTPTVFQEICPVEDLASTCDAPAGQGSSLQLTGSVGRIDAVHSGVDLPDCATWVAEALPDGDFVVDVVYEPLGTTTCPGECGWTFEWWIGVEPGQWTVNAAGDTATVTVR